MIRNNCPYCNQGVMVGENGELSKPGMQNAKNLFKKPKKRDWLILGLIALVCITAIFYVRDIRVCNNFYQAVCYCPTLNQSASHVLSNLSLGNLTIN